MNGWQLVHPPTSAVFTTRSVMNGETEVALLAIDDDGDWQALDAFPRGASDSVVVALSELLRVHSLMDVAQDLEQAGPGHQSRRQSAWTVEPINASPG